VTESRGGTSPAHHEKGRRSLRGAASWGGPSVQKRTYWGIRSSVSAKDRKVCEEDHPCRSSRGGEISGEGSRRKGKKMQWMLVLWESQKKAATFVQKNRFP